MATERSRNERIAKQALALGVKHAAAAVPVVGPALGFGVDLVDAVRTEIANEQSVSRDDVVRLLNLIDKPAWEHAIDEELSSDEGVKATSDLTQGQVLAVRRALMAMPSDLAAAVGHVHERERLDKAQARSDAIAQADQKQRQLLQKRADLDVLLAKQMRANEWKKAYRTVNKRINLGGATREHRRAERALYRQANPVSDWLSAIGLGLLGFFPTMILVADTELPDSLLIIAVAFGPLLILMGPLSNNTIASRLGRRGRGALFLIGIAWLGVITFRALQVI